MHLLQGLQVLEIAEMVAVPFAGHLLRQLGADVCKIEQPGTGDSSRSIGPFTNDQPDVEGSGLFAYLNAGKSSITLNWRQPTGRHLLDRLLRSADVLLVDDSSGMSFEDLTTISGAHPQLIVVSITPFGLTGARADWRGSHAIASAYSGLTLYAGEADREPLTPPYYLGDYQAGLFGGISAMLALYARNCLAVGGQVADVSTIDVLSTVHTGMSSAAYVFSEREFQRAGRRFPGAMYPYTMLRCKDGFFRLASLTGREWGAFLELMGNPDWSKDPRFVDRHVNQQRHADELDGLIEAWLTQHTKDELFAMCLEKGLPYAPVRTPDEVLKEPQLLEREFFLSVRLGNEQAVTVPGAPFRIAGRQANSGDQPLLVPRLGQDNSAVYRDRAGLTSHELLELRRSGVI